MKPVNSDLAYNFIRKRILSGEYAPGMPLMTNALSSAIGVSRTPVRDALRKLEADGLVVIKSHLGASVRTPDVNELRETCVLRLALESYAAGLAAENRTESDMQEMKMALDEMRRLTQQLLDSPDGFAAMDDLVREDIRFHIAIISAARNKLLKKEILQLHLINKVMSGNLPTDQRRAATTVEGAKRAMANALKSHDEIYEAILRADASAAKAAMESHIQAIIDAHMRKIATSSPGSPRELTEEELIYTT